MLFNTVKIERSMLAGESSSAKVVLRVWAIIAWVALIVILFLISILAHYMGHADGASAAVHLAELIGGGGIGAIIGERSGAQAKP